jgi:signal transduction histidine kinase/uncharacterized membrane protein
LSTIRDQSKINLLAAILAIVLVVWGVLEFALHTLRPDAIDREYRISGQFAATNKAIWDRHAELQIGALNLASKVAENIPSVNGHLTSIENLINSYPSTVQTAVFHNGSLVIWSDGMPSTLLQTLRDSKSAIYTDETGFFLIASASLGDSNENWQVFLSRRIFAFQSSDPNYGKVYSPEDPLIKRAAPSLFYLMGSPHMLPAGYRFNIMTVVDEQTTGFFVVSVNDPVIRRYLHPQLDRFMRTVVLVILVVLVWFLIQYWFGREQIHHRTISYLVLIWISYTISWYLGIPQFIRTFTATDSAVLLLGSVYDMIELVFSTFAIVFSAVLIARALIKQQRYYGINWVPRIVAGSLALGITGGISFGWLLSRIDTLADLIQFGFLTPSLVPTWSILLLFAIAGLSTIAVLLLNLSLGWFFANSEKTEKLTIASIASVSLIFSFYITVQQGYGGLVADHILIFIWIGLWALVTLFAGIMIPGNYSFFRFLGPVRISMGTAILVGLINVPSLVSHTYTSVNRNLEHLASGTPNYSQSRIPGSQISAPYIILTFNEDKVSVAGDFITGQFPEQQFIPDYIRQKLQDAPSGFSTRNGPFFRYREYVLQTSENQITVVRIKLPGTSNFVYATVRFILITFFILVLLTISFRYFRLIVNSRYEPQLYFNRIQENTLLWGLLMLSGLLFIAQAAVQKKNLNSIEMELLEQLELLQFAPQQELLQGTLFVGIDYDVFPPGAIIPASRNSTTGFSSGNFLLPYSVNHYLRQEGGTRLTRWKNTSDGNFRLTGYRIVRDENSSEYGVITISSDTQAGKYTNRLLQDMSFWTSIFLAAFLVLGYGVVNMFRNLLRPLAHLRRNMKRLADGRMDTLMNIEANNEVAEIAGVFNSMVFKIKDLRDEVTDSERKAVWTEIARQVAHEIKNPLTPMKLNIQHLYQQFEYGNKSIEELRPAVKRITDTVIREIDSLSNIAADFSRFARPMAETLERKDLNSILREVTDLYTHDQRIKIEFDPASQSIFVDVAADELKRVAVNLIKNATEAIGNTGVIAVRTYATQRYAYFEVVDNGGGIQEDDQTGIFKPNFSTKEGGSGLGLAMSKKIILAHKGNLRFASVESIGSTFTVQLPLSAEPADLKQIT